MSIVAPDHVSDRRRNCTTIPAWSRSSSTTRMRVGSVIGQRRSAAEQTGDSTAKRAKQPLNGARRLLLVAALMDWAQLSRNLIAVLEVLQVRRTAVDRLQIRDAAQFDRTQRGRDGQLACRTEPRDPLHEVRPDRHGDARGVRLATDRRRLIKADPHADDHRIREADEPRVLVFVRRERTTRGIFVVAKTASCRRTRVAPIMRSAFSLSL